MGASSRDSKRVNGGAGVDVEVNEANAFGDSTSDREGGKGMAKGEDGECNLCGERRVRKNGCPPRDREGVEDSVFVTPSTGTIVEVEDVAIMSLTENTGGGVEKWVVLLFVKQKRRGRDCEESKKPKHAIDCQPDW